MYVFPFEVAVDIYRHERSCSHASQRSLPRAAHLSQDIAQTPNQRTDLAVSVDGFSRVAVALKALLIETE
jgi:hypothetical protein